MAQEIRMDGDRWRVKLGEESPRAGRRAVLFFPTTCDQRPFRVVEVPEDLIGDEAGLEGLSERELRELFRDSTSMGVPKDYA